MCGAMQRIWMNPPLKEHKILRIMLLATAIAKKQKIIFILSLCSSILIFGAHSSYTLINCGFPIVSPYTILICGVCVFPFSHLFIFFAFFILYTRSILLLSTSFMGFLWKLLRVFPSCQTELSQLYFPNISSTTIASARKSKENKE